MKWELMKKRVRQYFKSKTLNFALLLQMTAVVQIYVDGLGNPLATMIVGLIVAYLRFKTTQPVHEK